MVKNGKTGWRSGVSADRRILTAIDGGVMAALCRDAVTTRAKCPPTTLKPPKVVHNGPPNLFTMLEKEAVFRRKSRPLPVNNSANNFFFRILLPTLYVVLKLPQLPTNGGWRSENDRLFI
jgi:hypothetical protein